MVTAAPAKSKVLVVEDEESLLFTLAHNLKREGYNVLTASRGDDGLKVARWRGSIPAPMTTCQSPSACGN